MKSKTINILKRLSDLTSPHCQNCPTDLEYRCCDKVFCEAARHFMEKLKVEIPKNTDHKSLPFMGEKGCILPPHHRPICAGYVCAGHLRKNRGLRRIWEQLHIKLFQDHEFEKMHSELYNIFKSAMREVDEIKRSRFKNRFSDNHDLDLFKSFRKKE